MVVHGRNGRQIPGTNISIACMLTSAPTASKLGIMQGRNENLHNEHSGLHLSNNHSSMLFRGTGNAFSSLKAIHIIIIVISGIIGVILDELRPCLDYLAEERCDLGWAA